MQFKNREEYEAWEAKKIKENRQKYFKKSESIKKTKFLPFPILQISSDILRKTNNIKAWLFAALALVWSAVLNISPIIVGIWLLTKGEILKAILVPILLYVIIGIFMSLWPFIAIVTFISGWIKYGFLDSLIGTIVFLITIFIFLFAPEWFMYQSYKAAVKAESISKDRVRRDEFEDEVREDEFEEVSQNEKEVVDDEEKSAYKSEAFTDSDREFSSEQSTLFGTKDMGIEESTDDLREEITEKRTLIAELTEELVSQKNELAVFEAEYHGRVGVLYVRLDELELAIKEYLRRIELLRDGKVKNLVELEKMIEEQFMSDYEKIKEEKEEAEQYTEEYEAVKKKPKLDEESEKRLKSLYRELAKKYHPDMARTPEEKEKFHKIMAEINQVYNDKDLQKMEELAMRLKAPERVFVKETLEEEFERLQRESEKLEEIISKLDEELDTIRVSDTYKFKVKVDEAKTEGRDLLKEMENNLEAKIELKEEELKKVKQDFKNLAGDLA